MLIDEYNSILYILIVTTVSPKYNIYKITGLDTRE